MCPFFITMPSAEPFYLSFQPSYICFATRPSCYLASRHVSQHPTAWTINSLGEGQKDPRRKEKRKRMAMALTNYPASPSPMKKTIGVIALHDEALILKVRPEYR